MLQSEIAWCWAGREVSAGKAKAVVMKSLSHAVGSRLPFAAGPKAAGRGPSEPFLGLPCDSQAGVWRGSDHHWSLSGVSAWCPLDRWGMHYISYKRRAAGSAAGSWPPKTCATQDVSLQ